MSPSQHTPGSATLPPRIPVLLTLLLFGGCTSDLPTTAPSSTPLFSAVTATTALVVSDEASCNALPVTTTWASDSCTLDEDLTLAAGASLTIEDVRVTVPTGGTLTNDGGAITVVFGGKLRILGALSNAAGGTITNSGFWDIRGGGAIDNDATSTITTGNQLHVTQGTLTNAGSLTNTSYMSTGVTGLINNTGTLDNSGTIKLESSLPFQNSGTINNTGTIQAGCGTTVENTGTINGNPIVQPFCWVGGHGVLWSNPANWNTGTVPTPEGPIVLFALGGGGPTLDIPFTLTGTLTMQLATLTIGSTGALTNEGTITLGLGGQLPGSTVILNQGTFTNNATLRNNDLLINHGTFTNNASIDPNSVVGVVENGGLFTNSAGAYFLGGIRILGGGQLLNFGDVDLNRTTNSNAGLVSNQSGAVFNVNNGLINDPGGQIENDGTLNITHDLTSPGHIDNATGAKVVNRAQLNITSTEAALNNDGLVEHTGVMDNGGIIQNNGVICGGGAINGNAVSGNPPQAACNSAPTAEPGGPYSGQEGVPMALALGGTDPDGQTLTFTWDLGDGTTGSGSSPPTAHTYGDNPTPPATAFTITLTVDDGAGGTDTKTTTATVENVAPTAAFAPSSPVDEGSAIALVLSGVQDVAADLATLEHRFDCGSGFGPWGSAPSASCPTEDDAVLSVGAEIRDKDGGLSSYAASVTVTNVAPSLGPLTLPATAVLAGSPVSVSASLTDPGTADTHTGFVRWNPGSPLDPASPGVDALAHTLTAEAILPPGLYQPELVVEDDDGGMDARLAASTVVVYDPEAGFLTGGGWIRSPAGALDGDPGAAGKGHFTFDAQYGGGAVPEGAIGFELPSAGFEFASSALSWMVVTTGFARVEGEGTVGGVPGYGFRVTAADRGTPGRRNDGVRIRIWHLGTGDVVYDDQAGQPPESDAVTLLGGGNVRIHR